MKTTNDPKAAPVDVKRQIFSVHSLVHTLSTRCPQLIHKRRAAVASRDHFSTSDAANFRSTPPRFDLSNENPLRVPMMRAGR
jgi:hypothetical protein